MSCLFSSHRTYLQRESDTTRWKFHARYINSSKVAGRKVHLFVCTFVCTVHRAVNHLQLLICVFLCHALVHKWKTWTIPTWCLYCCWTHNCAGCSKCEITMSLSFILQPNPQFRCWSHSRTVTERMEKDGESIYILSCLPHNALYSPSSFTSASNRKILNKTVQGKTVVNLIIPYSQSFSVYSSPSQMVICQRDWQVGWGNPY